MSVVSRPSSFVLGSLYYAIIVARRLKLLLHLTLKKIRDAVSVFWVE